jgi:UTP--glucose-1-phosphate uridylyltransferase
VDKPIIQYVVEEAVASGIKDIIIVTGWHKRAIEDHFDYPFELEQRLKEWGKLEMLDDMANFIYVRQKGQYGNGTPVLSAREVIGDEPFVVLWGDEFIYSKPPRTKQCIEVFEKYGDPVISAIKVPQKDVSRYGIVDVKNCREKHLSDFQADRKTGTNGITFKSGSPWLLCINSRYF